MGFGTELTETTINRNLEYPGQILAETELLTIQRNAYSAIGRLTQTVLGGSTVAYGLACTATAPASMQVRVAPGALYSLQNVDNNPYSTLPADTTDQIVKEGYLAAAVSLSCPAPTTTGQSIVYLVEAAFSETDGTPLVLQYFNSAQPSVAWSGPNNTGTAQNTTRIDGCNVQVKAGTAAATGSQTAPAPDTGFTPLYYVTVAYGATTIASANIATAAGAPFLSQSLYQLANAFQAGNGWFSIPGANGIPTIVQYGQVNVLGNGYTPVTFPIPFPNAVKSITTAPYLTSAGATSAAGFIGFSGLTLTGFTAFNENTNSGANYWQAIGD